MTAQGTEEASALVDRYYGEDKVLVVFLPECHESLAGIIAGRLREKYQKPSFVLTRAEGGAKGSGALHRELPHVPGAGGGEGSHSEIARHGRRIFPAGGEY